MSNKEIYCEYIKTIFNEARFELLDQYVSENYTLQDAPPGIKAGSDAIKQIVTMFKKAFPDLNISVDHIMAEGDCVASRSTVTGTHKGELFGLAPKGKKVSFTSLTMVKFANQKIEKSWVQNDMGNLRHQIEAGDES